MLKIAIPKLYYTAGEPLVGEVTYNPNKTKKIKSVVISLKGYEHTEWADTSKKNTDDRIPVEQRQLTHSRKRRKIISQQITVFPPVNPDQKGAPKAQELEGQHT